MIDAELLVAAPEQGWLRSPAGGRWVAGNDEPNPYLRHRELLWSWHRGWDDAEFVAAVTRLDAAVARVAGTGFRTTPIDRSLGLSQHLECKVWVKDETNNVGGSHKARHLFGLALHLLADRETADRPLAIASCGNAAIGAAVVARAADRPLDVFIPTWADEAVVSLLTGLDADLHVCERRPDEPGDPCIHRFREAVAAGAVPFGVQSPDSPMTIDGGRTLGWELAEHFAARGAVADHLYIQVGGGALLSSCVQGLADAYDAGIIERLPRTHAVEAEGCAPLARAHARLVEQLRHHGPTAALDHAATHPDDFMWPWESEPSSAATGILDDVTYDWLGVVRSLLLTGGSTIVVPEPIIVSAHRLARRVTDIAVSPTGTAGLAGLVEHHGSGHGPTVDESVVVLFTGIDRNGG